MRDFHPISLSSTLPPSSLATGEHAWWSGGVRALGEPMYKGRFILYEHPFLMQPVHDDHLVFRAAHHHVLAEAELPSFRVE